MSCSELILKWAEVLLQWQVLAFILALSIFIYLRKEISSIMRVIEKRGIKISSVTLSGEKSASKEDYIDLNNISLSSETPENITLDKQKIKFKELSEKFNILRKNGAISRSKFVKEIKNNNENIFSWDFLKEKISSNNQSERFVASSLLTTTLYEIDPIYLSKHFLHEPSSLVRYRLIETILLWLKTSKATGNILSDILTKLESYEEENDVVNDLILDLKRKILTIHYSQNT